MPYTQVMSKWKAGTLKSGGSGKPVHSQKQAVAIMLSEKKKAGQGKTEYQPSSSEPKASKSSFGGKVYE